MKKLMAAVLLSLISGTAAACPGNLSAQIKPGHYGAESIHAYKKMVKFQSQRRISDLMNLVRKGTVTELPAGEIACLHDSSRLSFRTLITAPGLDNRYWVHLNALNY